MYFLNCTTNVDGEIFCCFVRMNDDIFEGIKDFFYFY